jgi:hypothetical protein
MSRVRASTIRVAATLAALGLLTGVTCLLWYPGTYFTISGARSLILIIVAVNLVLGPGLTALIYKPGKWGLSVDVAVIAAVELCALLWAAHVIYDRRPYYTVFAVDRFEIVTRAEVDVSDLADEALRQRPGHTPRLLYAELPTDPKRREQLIDDVIFRGLADIDRRPEFWKPYAEGVMTVKAAAKPVSQLLNVGDVRETSIRRWLSRQSGDLRDYQYLPLRGRTSDAMMIIHAGIGYPVDIIDVDPW